MKSAIAFLSVLVLNLTLLHAEEGTSRQAPRHVGPPLSEHAVTNRAFSGIPSLAVTPRNRLWAVWYAGETPGEDLNNYVVLSTSAASDDSNRTWNEVLTIDPDGGGPVRSFDPELWMSPDGRLFCFWSQMSKGLSLWYIETGDPESAEPKWSAPRRLGYGVMMCKPLVLLSGEWVLPVSTWRTHNDSAQMIVSTDAGKTWTIRGGCNVPPADRQFDEHMFIERQDGSIWLLARTKYGIGESTSTDRGRTWPELRPSAILHTPARFFIRRLVSGNLLLVKHGPVNKRTGRSHLTAYVSRDDGITWDGGLMLDERKGVSYPDGQQTPDGLIRIIYDYSRTGDRNILMAAFREEDVSAGKAVSGAVQLRQLVSKASGGRKHAEVKHPVNDNSDGEPLRKKHLGVLSSADLPSRPFEVGRKLFSDRDYTIAEVPAALKSAQFLPIAMDGQKTLTCQRAGTVCFLTPAAGRNNDTQSQTLRDQGFEKVALPEVRLFGGPANYCTLYQKECSVGETILVGKWSVPVFFHR